MRSWDYIDFELKIQKGGPRDYPVTVRSSMGEAQEVMRFPFDEPELEQKLLALEIALLRSGGTRRRILSVEEQVVEEFGKALFEALFAGDVSAHYAISRAEARRHNKGLRLRLRIRPPELARLPWEFLYDPGRAEYLCLSTITPIVRSPDLPLTEERLPVSPPLKILGMVASPVNLDPLDVEYEKRLVEEGIGPLRSRGQVELTWLEGQTWRDLHRTMRREQWHVFYFIGHGSYDPNHDEGLIALTNEEGYAHFLRAQDLAQLLNDHHHFRLVLLNSCEGARSSPYDAFSSIAATLVRGGVPAVVAMQYEITDRAAIAFSQAFHEALAEGMPVDAAVAEARVSIKMELGTTLEWGTPVLYTRSLDGRIFDFSPDEQPVGHAQEARIREEDPLGHYREEVEAAWADRDLLRREVEWLSDLAEIRLGLNPSTAADIERDVMGDTKVAILERQETNATSEKRRKRLDDLYAQARQSHQDREWPRVIEIFEQIRAEDPEYPDPDELSLSARDALVDQKMARRVVSMYEKGLSHMEAEEWQQALRCFQTVKQLKPGFRRTELRLSQVQRELSDHIQQQSVTTEPAQEAKQDFDESRWTLELEQGFGPSGQAWPEPATRDSQERTGWKQSVKLFCSYSHWDEQYLDELKESLAPLTREGLIKAWSDHKLVPGQQWEEAINKNLHTADVILLLVSPAFMNSDFAYENEMGRALERHERREARVIPIIVRPVRWQRAPFSKLHVLPKGAKPITDWSNRDKAWLDVVEGIEKVVEEITGKLGQH